MQIITYVEIYNITVDSLHGLVLYLSKGTTLYQFIYEYKCSWFEIIIEVGLGNT